MPEGTKTPDDQGGADLPTTNRGQTPDSQRPVTRADLAYMMSMPQAFAASSQLAFGKKKRKERNNMCMSLESLIIDIIWFVVIVGVIRIVVPWILGLAQLSGPIVQIINLVLWGLIACFAVYILFGLFGCLGGAHSFLPRFN